MDLWAFMYQKGIAKVSLWDWREFGKKGTISSFARKHEWTFQVSLLVVHHIAFCGLEPLSRQKSAENKKTPTTTLLPVSHIQSLIHLHTHTPLKFNMNTNKNNDLKNRYFLVSLKWPLFSGIYGYIALSALSLRCWPSDIALLTFLPRAIGRSLWSAWAVTAQETAHWSKDVSKLIGTNKYCWWLKSCTSL